MSVNTFKSIQMFEIEETFSYVYFVLTVIMIGQSLLLKRSITDKYKYFAYLRLSIYTYIA